MFCNFTGPSDRQRLAALGDVDAREREAVEEAKARRAAADAAEDFDGLLVTVTEGDLDSIVDGGSVVLFTGTDANDRVVTFAADHRCAQDIVNIVRAEGELVCGVESWQVLRRTSPVTV